MADLDFLRHEPSLVSSSNRFEPNYAALYCVKYSCVEQHEMDIDENRCQKSAVRWWDNCVSTAEQEWTNTDII
jgi:hypothetical protein